MGTDDLLRKISGLLAKAESTTNEHEADAFFAKAHELMLKNAIDEARVREAAGKSVKQETPVKEAWMFATNDAHAKGKVALVEAIAQANHVMFHAYRNTPYSNRFREGNQGNYSQWGTLVGFRSDIENTKLLYASLLIQWTRFVRHDQKVSGYAPSEAYGFRTGHLVGFAGRISDRFQEITARVLDASGTALMVNKDAQVKVWYDIEFKVKTYCFALEPIEQRPRKNSRGRYCIQSEGHEGEHTYTYKPTSYSYGSREREVDSNGYYAGQDAAGRADLGQTKISTPSKQLQ